MAEGIRFPIVGEDLGATRVLKDVARESAVTAAQTRHLAEAQQKEERAAFDAAAANRVLAESYDKGARASLAAAKATESHTKADQLWGDTIRVLNGRTTEFTKLQHSMDGDLKKTGQSTYGLKARFQELAGGLGAAATGMGGSGMGAAIGAGIALSGQMVTLGFGFGGLALAAAGIVKPIENAAKASGGLAANMHRLDPEQQRVARGLLALGRQYGDFQQALQPQVLGIFNRGLTLAGHLMHDVQPIAKATGGAFEQVLGRIDAEFQSGQWQQFFGYMARQAGPDVQQLGTFFIDLTRTLPPLLKALHPVGQDLIYLADDIAKVTKAGADLGNSAQQQARHENVLAQVTDMFKTVLFAPGVGLLHALKLVGGATDETTGKQDRLGSEFHQVTIYADAAAEKTALVVSPMNQLGKLIPEVATSLGDVAANGKPVVTNFDQQITRLHALTTGYNNALTAMENYIGGEITQADDLKALNTALKASHDRIGLKTQAERNSYAATQTFINQTIQTGTQAVKTGHGIQGQIDIIQAAMGPLERVKGKTHEYKHELDLLKGILDKLRAEKLISEVVHVSGQGTWRFGAAPGGAVAGPGGRFRQAGSAGGFAAGGMVGAGTTGTADDVLARVSKGELIVPAKMVAAGLVDHLRGSLPGFAAGGIVPSYKGAPAGLPPWTSHNQQATITAISVAIARAMASSFMSMIAGGAPGAARHASLPWLEGLWDAAGGPPALAHLMAAIAMAESGGRPGARNPSGASGLWQILGLPFPGNPFNPLVNAEMAVAKYRSQGLGAWVTYTSGAYKAYYDRGGVLAPGVTMAVNNTGEPERVLSPAQSRAAGPVVQFGDVNIYSPADEQSLAQKLSFAITAAGLG